jgi:CRP/FNR family transcriptional regulator, transcriptional activator FtrB
MRASDVDIVRKLPLFRHVKSTRFKELISAGYLQTLPASAMLLDEGERPDFLHVLVEGGVELFGRHGDEQTTLTLLTPPAAFILAAVLLDSVYLTSVRTLTPTTLVMIPAEAVRKIFSEDSGFARATVVELAHRYRAVIKDLKNLRLRNSLERLANWILVQEMLAGSRGSFRMTIEKRVLASQLGMRPENLSRAFAELGKVGVSVKGPMITVDDRGRLAAHFRPNPLIDDPERYSIT